MLVIESPTVLRITGLDEKQAQLKAELTFVDQAAKYEAKRFQHARWYLNQYGQEAFVARLNELKAKVNCCLLFEDERGYWTYSGLAQRLSHVFKVPVENKIKYPEFGTLPYDKMPEKKERPYQIESKGCLLEAKHGGVEIGCHRKGQKVLTFDGSFKAVEDIVVGDQLMGPDSKPRLVLELKRGTDTMYKLETGNGQKMYINGHHLLVLRRTNRGTTIPTNSKTKRKDYKGTNPIVIVSVNDYLNKSDKFKHLYKTFSVPVEFNARKDLDLDPYFLGVVLGDGSLIGQVNVTSADSEIFDYCKKYTEKLGLLSRIADKRDSKASTMYFRFPGSSRTTKNPLVSTFKLLGLWGTNSGNKFIPNKYLTASRSSRLALLAGLIDTDGSNSDNCYDYITKSERLAIDVAYLARSLGFRVTELNTFKGCQTGAVGLYYRLTISGDLSEVPVLLERKKCKKRSQIKNATSFGFTLEKISDNEDYYGFVLDGDHQYLTDTLLVTHNTGLGKSHIIECLTKTIGLKTIIMAPSRSIAGQLYKQLQRAFGKKRVGLYGDGRKDFKKLITVGISASLTRVEKDSDAWKELSQAQVFIADESHLCPADTLASVCFGLCAAAPYRFFFSGTQLRADGAGLLLEAITGSIVFRMTVKEGVDQGYLAKPNFLVATIDSPSQFMSDDHMDMMNVHYYRNPVLAKHAANIANKSIDLLGHQVLILVEHVDQLQYLLPYFKHEVGFAHGGLTKDNKDSVDPRFHDSDPDALVDRFNAGDLPILVGTSCISTGTDIRTPKTVIYLQGGQSEVKIRQAIGRGTRLVDGKTTFNFVDYDVNLPGMMAGARKLPSVKRHAQTRREIYDAVYGPVKDI